MPSWGLGSSVDEVFAVQVQSQSPTHHSVAPFPSPLCSSLGVSTAEGAPLVQAIRALDRSAFFACESDILTASPWPCTGVSEKLYGSSRVIFQSKGNLSEGSPTEWHPFFRQPSIANSLKGDVEPLGPSFIRDESLKRSKPPLRHVHGYHPHLISGRCLWLPMSPSSAPCIPSTPSSVMFPEPPPYFIETEPLTGLDLAKETRLLLRFFSFTYVNWTKTNQDNECTHMQYECTHMQYECTHMQYECTHMQYECTHMQYECTHMQYECGGRRLMSELTVLAQLACQ
ncbi:hypothetical protein STEG23_017980 [Scotinomys teguina]